MARRKRETAERSFWRRVIKGENENSCWLWVGCTVGGYGKMIVDGKFVGAHRFSYVLRFGDISRDLCVLHVCDNRLCVNPSHLFLGDRKDNNKDMAKKGRASRRFGVDNPFFGKKHSEDTKQKIGEANSGRTASAATRKRMRLSRKRFLRRQKGDLVNV